MKLAIIAIIAVLAAAGGFFLQKQLGNPSDSAPGKTAQHLPVSMIGQLRPEFSLPDVEDKQHNIKEWDGKIRLVNFWATWCPPCVREMPMFVEMQEKHADKNFTVIGVAIDYKDAVVDFTDSIGVNYPILYGEMAALDLTTRYGNRLGVLPYSVFVDENNRIISTHNGEITAETIKNVLLSQNKQ